MTPMDSCTLMFWLVDYICDKWIILGSGTRYWATARIPHYNLARLLTVMTFTCQTQM